MSFNVKKVPIIGGDLAQIGQVYDIMSFGCGIKAEIWVYAFFRATPILLWSLMAPEPIDIDLQKGNRRKGRHRRFRFRVDEQMQPRLRLNSGLSWVNFAWGAAERIGWWLLVVDAVTDFAYNWTSTAYQWGGCRRPGTPYATLASGSRRYVPTDGWGYAFPGTESRHIFGAGVNNVFIPPGYNASFSGSASCDTTDHPELNAKSVACRIVRTQDSKIIAEDDGFSSSTGPGGVQLVHREWDTGGNPGTYEFQFRATGERSVAAITDVRCGAYGNKEQEMFPWDWDATSVLPLI